MVCMLSLKLFVEIKLVKVHCSIFNYIKLIANLAY